jgi:hypothetical protein
VFGTTDRRFVSAAGRVGFRLPSELTDEERGLYDRLKTVQWSPAMKRDGHHGGHTGWLVERFLQAHLAPTLRGETTLPVVSVE